MNDDRPPYMLSDEDLLMDDDLDSDPFADDVTDELDFDRFEPREYEREDDAFIIEGPEDDEIMDESEWYLGRESDIDNERW
jgi:hypothetical protein